MERIEGKLMGFHVLSLLKPMLMSKAKDRPEAKEEGKTPVKECEEDAKVAEADTVDLVTKTLQTGKVPDKKAACPRPTSTNRRGLYGPRWQT